MAAAVLFSRGTRPVELTAWAKVDSAGSAEMACQAVSAPGGQATALQQGAVPKGAGSERAGTRRVAPSHHASAAHKQCYCSSWGLQFSPRELTWSQPWVPPLPPPPRLVPVRSIYHRLQGQQEA